MSMDPIADLDLLQNIEAAPNQEPHPEQDDPLRNVPEEAMRNLDTLVVDMEQTAEVADQAQRVATEAVQIETSGLMDQLRAEEIARDVPAVLGTQDNPVSYTDVPTNVGVGRAVEILEEAAANSRDMAVTKINASIDRAMVMAQSVLDKDEGEWLAAIAAYATARSNVLEACGAFPEDSYDLYLGNRPAGEVLMEGIYRDSFGVEGVSSVYENFRNAIVPFITNGPSSLEQVFFANVRLIAVGEARYALYQLADGVIDPVMGSNDSTIVSGAQWLLGPVNAFTVGREHLRAGIVAFIEQLRILHNRLNEHGQTPISVAETATSVQQSILLASLLAKMSKALEASVAVTNAATQFYKEFVQNAPQPPATTVHPSQERIAGSGGYATKNRLFPKR